MARMFDDYEIHGCADFMLADDTGKYTEQVDDPLAEYWTLYGHITGEGVQAIGDFKSRAMAEDTLALITGRAS